MVLAPVPYEVRCEYWGEKHLVSIPELIVPRCSKCGRISIHLDAEVQIDAAFRKKAGILSAEEIQKQRTELGLTQEALADAIGVPVETFRLWENGFQYQQRSHDRFLRAFFKVPELRVALANNQSIQAAAAAAPTM